MTVVMYVVWGQAIHMALDLGAWRGLERFGLAMVMAVGPLLLFRPRQRRDEGVFDYEEEL